MTARTASHDWKSAYPRQPKLSAHMVRLSHNGYRFIHPRFTIIVATIEELNAVLVELGRCPVRLVNDRFENDVE